MNNRLYHKENSGNINYTSLDQQHTRVLIAIPRMLAVHQKALNTAVLVSDEEPETPDVASHRLEGTIGLSSDHLLELEMVEANGKVIRANKNCNAYLFWAYCQC